MVSTLASGIVWVPDQAQVRAETDGFVVALAAHDGDAVEPGQPVLVLTDSQLLTERAYALAKSGRFANFSAVKKALKREFNVDRELVGRSLSLDITRVCHESRLQFRATEPLGSASLS